MIIIYLGQITGLDRSNVEKEVSSWIRLGWAAFGKLRLNLLVKIPQCLKAKGVDQCVLPFVTYGTETWLPNGLIRKLNVTRSAMQRVTLEVSLWHPIWNEEPCKITREINIIQIIAELRLQWAGYIPGRTDGRWSRNFLEWLVEDAAWADQQGGSTTWWNCGSPLDANNARPVVVVIFWGHYVQQWTMIYLNQSINIPHNFFVQPNTISLLKDSKCLQ